MSRKLDDELAQAIREGQSEATTHAGAERNSAPGVEKPATPPPLRASRPAKSLGLLAALLAMVGAVVTLFLVGFKEAAVYAVSVTDLVAQGDGMVGRKVRVEGELVPGTLVKRDDPCEYRFIVHTGDDRLAVRYPNCVVPDTFRDRPEGGVEVKVEGTLKGPDDFEATLVMAQCASKYDPASRTMAEATAAPKGAAPAPDQGDKPIQ